MTAPHRRPSPPQLHEQPRLSLEARRAYRDFLEFPIARQALLAVVPEYDRIAPPLAKPVRMGLHGLADGSLLQIFALVVALARLTLAPVDYAAAALAAGDEEGRERLRAALAVWPAGVRRRIHAWFRALVAERASARARGTEPKGFARRPVSTTPARVLINPDSTCLRNSDSESHQPCSEPRAKALSLSHCGRTTPSIRGRRSAKIDARRAFPAIQRPRHRLSIVLVEWTA